MSETLRIEREVQGGTEQVRLSGELTEDAQLHRLRVAERSRCVIDLAGVRRINSCGVREWIDWVRVLPRSATVRFLRVSQGGRLSNV